MFFQIQVCFCQKKRKKKRNDIGCYLCLLLRSSVFLNDIRKNCVSPQPKKNVFIIRNISKRNSIPSSLTFILRISEQLLLKNHLV